MSIINSSQNNSYYYPLRPMVNSIMDLSLANTNPFYSSIKKEKQKPTILNLPSELLENIISIAIEDEGLRVALSPLFRVSKCFHKLLPKILSNHPRALYCFIERALDKTTLHSDFQATMQQLQLVWNHVREIDFGDIRIHCVPYLLQTLIQCCPNLQTINLSQHSSITISFDPDCKIFSTLKKLKHFNLSCWKTSDEQLSSLLSSLPDSIESLTFHLTTIPNNLLLSSLPRFTKLNTLHLDDCDKFTGIGFKKLHLENLKSFQLDKNSITDDILANLLQLMPNVRKLRLDSCDRITGDCFKNLRFEELESFQFSQNKNITDNILIAFPQMPELRTLDISYCPCLTVTGFAKICASSPILEILKIRGTNTGDNEFTLLPKMVRLHTLDLRHCSHFTGTGLAKMQFSFPVLTHLKLSMTSISNDAFASLPEIVAKLRILELIQCPYFTGAGFKNFSALETLYLLKTAISIEHLTQLPQMPNLHRVIMTTTVDNKDVVKKILHSKAPSNLFKVLLSVISQ